MRIRLLWALSLAFVLLLPGCTAQITDATLKDRIRAAVREDPAMILDALGNDKVALLEMIEAGARERREQAMLEKWKTQMADPLTPALDDSRPMLGTADAPVTVVSYTDFQCGYCARGAKTIKSLIAQFPGRIRYVAKHAPMSENGEYSARVFEALGMQRGDLAWAFAEQAFERQGEIDQSPDVKVAFLALALALPGVDADRLAEDMESGVVRDRVRDDAREFLDWGFQGVPVYLFNGVAVEGAMPEETLIRVLDIVDGGQAAAPAAGHMVDAYSPEEAGACSDCLKQD